MQSDLAYKAIHSVNSGTISYCKFLAVNDTKRPESHQYGIYIAKNAWQILFNTPGNRGENKDKFVEIKWQSDFITISRFVWYGRSKNEYRITQFGRNFPFLRDENIGDLFILVKLNEEEYQAYVLSTDEEIEHFLNTFGMSPADTNRIIETSAIQTTDEIILNEINKYITGLSTEFPLTSEISSKAREIYYAIYNNKRNIITNPDHELIKWIEMEFRLFKQLEYVRYSDIIQHGFTNVDDFIETANMVLNRRKSRAGKSLEHHLISVFDNNHLHYTAQPVTEGNKRPDFIFPGVTQYHNTSYSESKLVFLGAKTTCKDRWRQILSEASRIQTKHLFTLQQGISSRQLREMEEEHVILVVPKPYVNTFPEEFRSKIMSLRNFIEFVKEKTAF